jgi:hypothetical protein
MFSWGRDWDSQLSFQREVARRRMACVDGRRRLVRDVNMREWRAEMC